MLSKSNVSPYFSDATRRIHNILVSSMTSNDACFGWVKMVGFKHDDDHKVKVIFHLRGNYYEVVQFYANDLPMLSDTDIIDCFVKQLGYAWGRFKNP